LWFFASILVKRCGLKHSPFSTLCKFKQYYFIRICFNALTISYGKQIFQIY
jgi:hypothetical protein